MFKEALQNIKEDATGTYDVIERSAVILPCIKSRRTGLKYCPMQHHATMLNSVEIFNCLLSLTFLIISSKIFGYCWINTVE